MKRRRWMHRAFVACLALCAAAQVFQIVIAALGFPVDALMVIIQGAAIIILCGLCTGQERQLNSRRNALEQRSYALGQWGDALNRRHLSLDRREEHLNEIGDSLAWWKDNLL